MNRIGRNIATNKQDFLQIHDLLTKVYTFLPDIHINNRT